MMSGCGNWAGKVRGKPVVFEAIEDIQIPGLFQDKKGEVKRAHDRMSKIMGSERGGSP